MMNKVGFLVENLGASQAGYYLCKGINDFVGANPSRDIICYYEFFEPECLYVNCASLHIAEAWMQDGIMIATSQSTAEKLIGFPSTSKKYFYVWDLEWLRREGVRQQLQNTGYSPYSPYLNPRLELICRSKYHADIIENNFNRKVEHIVDDFNINQIMEIVKNDPINI